MVWHTADTLHDSCIGIQSYEVQYLTVVYIHVRYLYCTYGTVPYLGI